MMILHTVNKSPLTHSGFTDCLNSCAQGSSIILIEDGVYAAVKQQETEHLLGLAPGVKLYALEADIIARGLADQLLETVTITNDSGFVKLVTEHDTVVSWY